MAVALLPWSWQYSSDIAPAQGADCQRTANPTCEGQSTARGQPRLRGRDTPSTRKAPQRLVASSAPALRNQASLSANETPFVPKCRAKILKQSQRVLTSIVPVANKPCAEFMSQTLFSLKQRSHEGESISNYFRERAPNYAST